MPSCPRRFDLLSGSRVELSSGPAVPAVYASTALAGIFDRFVDVLDFGARRHCVAAGWAATRGRRRELEEALAA